MVPEVVAATVAEVETGTEAEAGSLVHLSYHLDQTDLKQLQVDTHITIILFTKNTYHVMQHCFAQIWKGNCINGLHISEVGRMCSWKYLEVFYDQVT